MIKVYIKIKIVKGIHLIENGFLLFVLERGYSVQFYNGYMYLDIINDI